MSGLIQWSTVVDEPEDEPGGDRDRPAMTTPEEIGAMRAPSPGVAARRWAGKGIIVCPAGAQCGGWAKADRAARLVPTKPVVAALRIAAHSPDSVAIFI